ncbi:MAG: TIM-barrel domain-containing protein [Myxococcota bacterium]
MSACGGSGSEELPDSWSLHGPGLTVEVTADPYGYTVRDADGTVVLSTMAGGDAEGYAPVAWTTGRTHWQQGLLTKGHYTFAFDGDPWREGFHAVEAREPADGTLELVLDGPEGPIVVTHEVGPSTLRVHARRQDGETPRAWAAAFATPEDEGFLGFGERFNRTDQRGVDVYAWAEEGGVGTGEGEVAGPGNPEPNGEAMTYFPVPFFVSTEGYGFWLDSTWRNEFNLATERDDAWRVWHLGPELAYEVYVPIPEDERPWPYHLVDLFTARTGRPMLPPAWTLGPRRRINSGDMQVVDGVEMHEIEAMRALDLAITGVDDSVHFLPKGRHVGREAELAEWVQDGHDLGYRMNCYYNSLFAVPSTEDSALVDVVREGLDAGHFLEDAEGEPIEVSLISGGFTAVLQLDFTDDAATTWYQDKLDWALDLGYDGWMYDFGEYVQPETLAANGMTGEELHNLYPVLYQRAAHEALEESPIAGAWLAFARSGYTGSQQWAPMIWSGDPAASFEDSDGLPSMPRAGINLGVSGVPQWGGDIGGFHCAVDGAAAADGELMTRWIQQGAMSPNMQDQDACSLSNDEAEKASIWTAPEAMEAWRTYARLHTRLFPYLWALAHEAHATGAPYMRHVFLEHPERPDLAGVDGAYYFGPALFVAPVVARGQVEKTVQLPEGWYLDWRDGVLLAGGGEVTLDAPLDKLPLLLRDGYLIPMLDPRIDTLMEESHTGTVGDSGDVVGPTDVADVYDVVGLLSTDTGAAHFVLADGGTLEATWTGGFSPPDLAEVGDPAELADCEGGCYHVDDTSIDGVTRVRITHDEGASVAAGGLSVGSTDVDRRIRWDLYLVE